MARSPRKRHQPKPIPSLDSLGEFQSSQLKELQAEIANRQIEALKLYQPTEHQKAIHESRASEILVIGGNRSGKSMTTFVEDARAVCGMDPHDKYPKADGNLVIIGRDWKHIGMVVYPMLFRAGAFKIIRDADTKQWRAYNPATDADRKEEAKPAPPLIPPRMIKKISWLLKSASYIQSATLHNGWTIYFFSSEGEPPQGFQANRVHIDEDIANESWVPEMQARLADRKGVLCWSAMPHSRNDALLGLSERADEAASKDNPDIAKFVLRFLDNPHIDEAEKKKMLDRWSALGQDVLRMRAEGEFISDSILVYPTFSMDVHGYNREDLPKNVVPPNWCRYAAIDPGHAVTAVLFGAVPPDESMVLIYDQLYIRQCNATIFGELFEKRVRGQYFQAFIIDMHGGRLRDIGSGRLPVEQYTEQLRDRSVKSAVTGSSFLAGCDDIGARLEATQNYLHIQPTGLPKLRVLRGAVPDLEREIKKYKKKVNNLAGNYIVTDKPNTRGEVHACQCLEYLCAYRPRYIEPPLAQEEEPWYVEWARKRRKARRGGDNNFVYLGPRSGEPR